MDQQSLELKTVEELKNICRQDRQKYYGFSKFSRKKDLITFIIQTSIGISSSTRFRRQVPNTNQNTTTSTNQTTNGPSLYGIPLRNTLRSRGRPVPQNLRNNPVNVVYQSTEDDYNEIMNEMFYENDVGYYTEYELNEEDEIFTGRFSDDKISQFISDKEKEIKSWDNKNSIVFDSCSNFDKDMMYNHYKKQYFRKNGTLSGQCVYWETQRIKNEMILFHGTDKENISEILEYDFALTIGERHGHMFGKGIYFTNDLKKAISYSEKNNKVKYIIVAQVHIGDVCQGRMNMDIHPKIPDSDKRYDTSVDNMKHPIQFIKKANNQYNILGVLKINIVSMRSEELLPNKLQIINKSNQLIKIYWIPPGMSIKDFTSKGAKYLGSADPKTNSITWKTSYGHQFVCTTVDGIIKHITITKPDERIIISEIYNSSNNHKKTNLRKSTRNKPDGRPTRWKCNKCSFTNNLTTEICYKCKTKRV